jgi:hypothetical protein
MSTLLYAFLDLPDPPKSVIDQAFLAYEEKKKIGFIETNLHDIPGHKEYRNRAVRFKDGSYINSIESYRYWISEEYDDWIKTHVQEETKGCGINIFESGKLVAPHVDANRNYVIQYILEAGGDNVETAWYRQKGKDIIRSDIRHVFDLNKIVLDYDHLEELGRICFPARTWVCLSTNILHAVENLIGRRLALQISRQDAPDHIKYLKKTIV